MILLKAPPPPELADIHLGYTDQSTHSGMGQSKPIYTSSSSTGTGVHRVCVHSDAAGHRLISLCMDQMLLV
jgi:hypothetical protein